MTETEQKRIVGKVIKVHKSGYFFITSKELPFTRIFGHWSSLVPETINFVDLKRGDEVEFTPIKTEDKGWRAVKVNVLSPSNFDE